MGMMSLTLRIRFWSVNRYLAERKTGHLDAERAARKPRRPVSVRRGRWRRASRGPRPRPRRDHRASLLGEISRANGEDFDGALSLPLCRSDGNTGQGRLPAPFPNPLYNVGDRKHRPLSWRGETGRLWVQRVPHCSSKINSETKIGSSIGLHQLSFGFLVSCPLLW